MQIEGSGPEAAPPPAPKVETAQPRPEGENKGATQGPAPEVVAKNKAAAEELSEERNNIPIPDTEGKTEGVLENFAKGAPADGESDATNTTAEAKAQPEKKSVPPTDATPAESAAAAGTPQEPQTAESTAQGEPGTSQAELNAKYKEEIGVVNQRLREGTLTPEQYAIESGKVNAKYPNAEMPDTSDATPAENAEGEPADEKAPQPWAKRVAESLPEPATAKVTTDTETAALPDPATDTDTPAGNEQSRARTAVNRVASRMAAPIKRIVGAVRNFRKPNEENPTPPAAEANSPTPTKTDTEKPPAPNEGDVLVAGRPLVENATPPTEPEQPAKTYTAAEIKAAQDQVAANEYAKLPTPDDVAKIAAEDATKPAEKSPLTAEQVQEQKDILSAKFNSGEIDEDTLYAEAAKLKNPDQATESPAEPTAPENTTPTNEIPQPSAEETETPTWVINMTRGPEAKLIRDDFLSGKITREVFEARMKELYLKNKAEASKPAEAPEPTQPQAATTEANQPEASEKEKHDQEMAAPEAPKPAEAKISQEELTQRKKELTESHKRGEIDEDTLYKRVADLEKGTADTTEPLKEEEKEPKPAEVADPDKPLTTEDFQKETTNEPRVEATDGDHGEAGKTPEMLADEKILKDLVVMGAKLNKLGVDFDSPDGQKLLDLAIQPQNAEEMMNKLAEIQTANGTVDLVAANDVRQKTETALAAATAAGATEKMSKLKIALLIIGALIAAIPLATAAASVGTIELGKRGVAA